MLCFQSVLYCIVLYNDVFTFLYVAVGNKLLLLLLINYYYHVIIAQLNLSPIVTALIGVKFSQVSSHTALC